MSERWNEKSYQDQKSACRTNTSCTCKRFWWCAGAENFKFGDWRDEALATMRAKPQPNGYSKRGE